MSPRAASLLATRDLRDLCLRLADSDFEHINAEYIGKALNADAQLLLIAAWLLSPQATL